MAQIQNDPKESQKPAKVIEGMITGRIKKELKEICLLDQTYVKAEDGKQSVAKYVEQVAKENGAKITVKGFVRYETGDGIEKKEENFAEEVAKQMAQYSGFCRTLKRVLKPLKIQYFQGFFLYTPLHILHYNMCNSNMEHSQNIYGANDILEEYRKCE